MQKRTYELIPLIENEDEELDPEKKEMLKNFYAIQVSTNQSKNFIGSKSYGYILFNEKIKKIGDNHFRMPSEISPDSSSEEILKELKRFVNARYKQISMDTYPHLKPIQNQKEKCLENQQ